MQIGLVFSDLGVDQCSLCSLAAGKHSFGQTGSSPKHKAISVSQGAYRQSVKMCHLCESASKKASDLSVCICHCLCFGLVLLVSVSLLVHSQSVATLSYFLVVCPAPSAVCTSHQSFSKCAGMHSCRMSKSWRKKCLFFMFMYVIHLYVSEAHEYYF